MRNDRNYFWEIECFKSLKGSFTIEASIFFSVLFLIVVMFFHRYLFAYSFYAYRNVLSLSNAPSAIKNQALYQTTYVKKGRMLYLNREKNIEVYEKSYEYLKCTHHLMMGQELGEGFSDFIENY